MSFYMHQLNTQVTAIVLIFLFLNTTSAQLTISKPVTLLESTQGIVSPFNFYIYKDSRGLVWICSASGLYQYDGKRVREYQPDPQGAVSYNLQHVHSYFCEDRAGNVWFGTWRAIYCYIRSKDEFKPYLLADANPGTRFTACGFDSLSQLWFVHDDALFTLGTTTGTMQRRTDVRPKHWNAELQLDKTGNVRYVYCYNRYKAAPGLSIHTFNASGDHQQDTILFTQTQDSIAVGDVHVVNDTTVLIATSLGLFRYHPEKAALHLLKPDHRPRDWAVNAITSYKDSLFLIATDKDAYYVFDPISRAFKERFEINTLGEQLTDAPLSMYTDHDGGIWIHLTARGVAYFHPRIQHFNYYPIEVEQQGEIQNLSIVGFLQLDDRTVLASGRRSEAYEIRTDGRILEGVNTCQTCPPEILNMFRDSRGRILLSTSTDLHLMDSHRKLMDISQENRKKFNMGFFHELPDGRVLYCADGSLFISEKTPADPPSFSRLGSIDTSDYYMHLAILPDGLIYVSSIQTDYTKDFALKVFNPMQDFKMLKSFPVAWGICSSTKVPGTDQILVGTTEGPFLYNTSSLTFSPISFAACKNESIWQIYPIDDHRFFMISDKCASLLDLKNESAFLYGLEHGLGKTGTSWTAFMRHSSGHIWLGHNTGISILDPDHVDIPDLVSPVNITAIRVNNQLYPQNNSLEITNPNEITTLRLPYRQNTISFDFAALSYAGIDANTYQYRLIGAEDKWVDGERQGFARYINLPAGNYTFEVRVKDKPQSVHTVHLSIIPPFYARTWFHFLIGVCLITVIFQFLKWREQRRQRILQLQYEKQLAIEQERVRISNNLHDDLGSGLSALNLRAQVLAQQTQDPQIKTEVNQLAANTQNLVGQIRETIWSINAQYDTIDSLVTRLHEYALDYFERSNVHCKVKLMPEEVKTVIPGHHRREIYLAFKEALHNIIKHAIATEVTIDMALDSGFLVIRIQDNGRGFDMENHSSGMGIRSMQRRMQEVGGTMEFTSDASGTRIALKYPV